MTSPVKGMKWAKFPIGNVTQWYGENPKLYMEAVGLDGHNGIDIVAPWGTPLLAVEDGIVCNVKTDPNGYGMHVRMFSADIKREWTYGHCSAIGVVVGEKVKAGQVLATMGNTGFVVSGNTPYWQINPSAGSAHPGTHCHFGKRNIKRSRTGWAYKGSDIKIEVLNYDNGKKGSVDPLPDFLPPDLLSSKVIAYASQKQSMEIYRIGEALQKLGK